jgi:hypothetical protein
MARVRLSFSESFAIGGGVCWVLAAVSLAGCGADETHATATSAETMKQDPSAGGSSGIHIDGEIATFRTDAFSLEPGQERFVCFTTTLDRDLVIDGYRSARRTFLHHLVFVRSLVPEPDGMSECDTLFRRTWDPLFLAGAGASQIDFPNGLGHELKAGTQLVAQLHLLNVSSATVTDSVELAMHRSSAAAPRPVGAFVFGTQDFHLPAGRSSQLESTCSPEQPVTIFAAFPHMHLLGTAMSFEVGPSADALETVFMRDPYDFDDQHMDLLDLTIKPGDVTRVRCSYDNTLDHEVMFGESTTNEMCFFVGFAADLPGLKTCLDDAGVIQAP